MNIHVLGAALASIIISGCSRTGEKCAHFPSAYTRVDIAVSKLKKVSLSLPEVRTALATIQSCYLRNRYMGFDNELRIREVVRHRNDKYLVVATLHGVSDLLLIFEIDGDGRVIDSYQMSTL